MLPSPSDLAHFLEVANTHNMSRAAERLGLTQPALSQSMKRLESNFGQQLLLRGKTGVVLTKAGERLRAQARELLETWEKLKENSQKDSYQVRGRYTIGLHSSVALYTIPHFVAEIMRKFEGLELKLSHDLSRRITEDVVSFKLDFGLVVNPIEHPDLIIKELFKDEVGFWKAKKTNPNNDLNSNKGVLIVEPDLTQTQTLLEKLNKKKINFKRTISSSNLEVIKSLVIHGAGIGVLPGRVVGDWGKKLDFLDHFPVFKDRICLIYRADVQKAQASRQLAREIAEHLMRAS